VYSYRATISSAFLDKLETPSRFVPSDPVRVSYSELSLRSPKKFLKSLPRGLGLSRTKSQGAVESSEQESQNGVNGEPKTTESMRERAKRLGDTSSQSPTPGDSQRKRHRKRATEHEDASSPSPTSGEPRKKQRKKKRVTELDDDGSQSPTLTEPQETRGRKRVREHGDAGSPSP
jgi:hypothetical protein